jgi:CheY-like chemotaxis protein
MPSPTDPTLRILVVDDDPSMVKPLARLLRSAGHSVETAISGDEALIRFKKGRFDLVITDHQMAGMNGDELAAAIKALVPIQPVLMVTAYAEQLRLSSRLLSTVDMVIDKPCQDKELFEAIAKLLAKR